VVATKRLDNDLAAALTEALMSARRDLLGELPILTQMTARECGFRCLSARSSGCCRLLQWYAAELPGQMGKRDLSGADDIQRRCFRADGRMEIPSGRRPMDSKPALDSLYALADRIRATEAEPDLSEIEREIDKVLRTQRAKAMVGSENALDVATLIVAAHRLQSVVHDRRILLVAQPSGSAQL